MPNTKILSHKITRTMREMSTQLGPISTDLFVSIIAEIIRSEPPAMPIRKTPPAKVKSHHGETKSLKGEVNSIAIPKPD